MRYLVIVAVLLACTGCVINTDPLLEPTAQALALEPVDYPDFISGIGPDPGSHIAPEEEICVTIYTGGLLSDGDTEITPNYQILNETHFYINNEPLPIFVPTRPEISGILREIINGVATGYIGFCFSPHLATGSHLLSVEVPTSAGNALIYDWAYVVE